MISRLNFILQISAEYWDNVFEHFLTEYQSDAPPIQIYFVIEIKSGQAFLEYALDLDDLLLRDIT